MPSTGGRGVRARHAVSIPAPSPFIVYYLFLFIAKKNSVPPLEREAQSFVV